MASSDATTAGGGGEASIITVAQRAGVSVATVSRVLNGSDAVRPATRDRILGVVKELGYRVNESARNLRTAESRLLLTLVPDVGNPFYAEIIRGIDSVARQHDYLMLLCDTGADLGRERTYFDLLRRRRADGAICLDPETIQRALGDESISLPWVACCEFDAAASVPYVGIDNHLAACDAVRHLLSRGHRDIALVNASSDYMYAKQRQAGYRDALLAAGVTPAPEWCINVDSLDFDAGVRAAQQLMALADQPSAIFAVSDTLAIGVLSGLRAAGKRVPEDVAVVGFDDIALARQVDPALTTIAQPMRELGEAAANLLLQRMANPALSLPGILLPHRLVVRQST